MPFSRNQRHNNSFISSLNLSLTGALPCWEKPVPTHVPRPHWLTRTRRMLCGTRRCTTVRRRAIYSCRCDASAVVLSRWPSKTEAGVESPANEEVFGERSILPEHKNRSHSVYEGQSKPGRTNVRRRFRWRQSLVLLGWRSCSPRNRLSAFKFLPDSTRQRLV